jgi:hypothetical protein
MDQSKNERERLCLRNYWISVSVCKKCK